MKLRTLLQSKKACYSFALFWTVALVLALSIPGDSIPEIKQRFPWSLPEGTDKGVHAFLFLFETIWLFLAFRLSKFKRHALSLSVGIAVLLAVATEGWQTWIPERSSHWADLVANLVGIALGILYSRLKVTQFFAPEIRIRHEGH